MTPSNAHALDRDQRGDAEIIPQSAERLPLVEGAHVMHAHRTFNAGPDIAPHQSPRQRIFFHDRDPVVKFRQNYTGRQTTDTGTDDQDFSMYASFPASWPYLHRRYVITESHDKNTPPPQWHRALMADVFWYFTGFHKRDRQNRRDGRRRCKFTDEPPIIDNGMRVSRERQEVI